MKILLIQPLKQNIDIELLKKELQTEQEVEVVETKDYYSLQELIPTEKLLVVASDIHLMDMILCDNKEGIKKAGRNFYAFLINDTLSQEQKNEFAKKGVNEICEFATVQTKSLVYKFKLIIRSRFTV